MSDTTRKPRRPLSRSDLTILGLQVVGAGVVGTLGFLGADDPGWRDLQRMLVIVLVGLWVGGIMVVGVIARVVTTPWVRTAILLAGPFIGVVAVIGRSMLGWS